MIQESLCERVVLGQSQVGVIHEVELVLKRIRVLVILILLRINIRLGVVSCRYACLLIVCFKLGKKPYYRVMVRVCDVTGYEDWLLRTSKNKSRHY